MERRGFIGSLIVGILGLFGVRTKASTAEANDRFVKQRGVEVSFLKLKEQLVGHWQLRNPPLKRCWKPADVHFSSVNCGAGTCPPGPEYEGFRAIITTPNHAYSVVAEPNYLGCIMSNRYPLPGEDWTRGSDLADGKRTVETWHRIVADIMRIEAGGSKYS